MTEEANTKLSNVEQRVERVRAGEIVVQETVGGIQIATLDHMFKIADSLSRSGVAVPPHCREQPGTVFALLMQAQEWGLPYMSVINKSYVTKGKGGVERLAYEAQLIHTLIETRANLTGKLRQEYIGEGDDMICRVIGTFKGETTPHTWESEKLGKIREDIGRNDQGNFKGSPLWITKPKVQLHYSTSRDWARVHCPWVILGVYTPDEIAETELIDVTPKVAGLVQRLKDAKAGHTTEHRGFDADHVQREAGRRGATIHDDEANTGDVATREASDGEAKGGVAGGNEGDVRERRVDGVGSGGDAGAGGPADREDRAAEAGAASGAVTAQEGKPSQKRTRK